MNEFTPRPEKKHPNDKQRWQTPVDEPPSSNQAAADSGAGGWLGGKACAGGADGSHITVAIEAVNGGGIEEYSSVRFLGGYCSMRDERVDCCSRLCETKQTD